MDHSAVYRVPEEVIDRPIGDELLLHRFDNDEVYVLNGHARIVFEAVKALGTYEAVRQYVLGEVFGDAVELSRAVEAAMEEMLKLGLIVSEPDPSD